MATRQQTTAFKPTALYQTRMVDPKTGMVEWGWTQHFQRAAQQLDGPVGTQAPATSLDPTPAGALATDGTWLYCAVAPNQWKRILLVSF